VVDATIIVVYGRKQAYDICNVCLSCQTKCERIIHLFVLRSSSYHLGRIYTAFANYFGKYKTCPVNWDVINSGQIGTVLKSNCLVECPSKCRAKFQTCDPIRLKHTDVHDSTYMESHCTVCPLPMIPKLSITISYDSYGQLSNRHCHETRCT
jgi:hypothetical protein